jgi:hypothetical protein
MLVRQIKVEQRLSYIKRITLIKSTISSLIITSSSSKKISIKKGCKHIQDILQIITLSSTKVKSNTYLKKNPTPPALNAQLK